MFQLSRVGDVVGIIRVGIIAIFTVPALYGICNFGDQVTQRFEDVGDAIYQLTWYELPPDLRKYIPTMISIAQKGVYVHGYGDIRTTRQIFKKVCIETLNRLQKKSITSNLQIIKNKFYYFMLMWKFRIN